MPQTVLRSYNHTHATGHNGHINHNGHANGGFSGHGHNGYAHHNGHASYYAQNGHANHGLPKNGLTSELNILDLMSISNE